MKKTVAVQPSDCKFNNDEKQEVLTRENTVPRKIENYIGNSFDPAKEKLIDPSKDSVIQPLSLKGILDESEILRVIVAEPC